MARKKQRHQHGEHGRIEFLADPIQDEMLDGIVQTCEGQEGSYLSDAELISRSATLGLLDLGVFHHNEIAILHGLLQIDDAPFSLTCVIVRRALNLLACITKRQPHDLTHSEELSLLRRMGEYLRTGGKPPNPCVHVVNSGFPSSEIRVRIHGRRERATRERKNNRLCD